MLKSCAILLFQLLRAPQPKTLLENLLNSDHSGLFMSNTCQRDSSREALVTPRVQSMYAPEVPVHVK